MTTTDGYLVLIPSYLALLPALPVGLWLLRRDWTDARIFFALVALGHVTAVLALTIFPIPIGGQDYYRLTRGLSEDNLVPFATIAVQLQHLGPNTIRQLLGNVLALMPLGVYAPELWPSLRDPRRFMLLAVGFGVAIELAQLAGSLVEGFTYRVTDVDDAIMNATGAILAFAAWRWLEGRGLRTRVLAFLDGGHGDHP